MSSYKKEWEQKIWHNSKIRRQIKSFTTFYEGKWRNINGISTGATINETSSKIIKTFQSLPYKEAHERFHGMVQAPTEEDINDEPEIT